MTVEAWVVVNTVDVTEPKYLCHGNRFRPSLIRCIKFKTKALAEYRAKQHGFTEVRRVIIYEAA